MEKHKLLHNFTKTLIEFMLFSGMVICAAVPMSVLKASSYYPFIAGIAFQLIAVLMISGTMGVYVLWKLRQIFKTIVYTNPYTLENARTLRKIAAAAFIIAVTFLYKCFFWFTLATVLIIIIFAVLGLFCLVLADVFEQAVHYKEENDLTI